MKRGEEEEEAGPALPARRHHKGTPIIPIRGPLSNTKHGGKAELSGPSQHSHHNDSGYSSSVLTSPESCIPGPPAAPPPLRGSSFPSSTPEVVGRMSTRLTSTPHNNARQDVAFRLPLPKIEAIGSVGAGERRRNRHNSNTDSPIITTLSSSSSSSSTTATKALEMRELEMTSKESNTAMQGRRPRFRAVRSPQGKQSKDLIRTTQQQKQQQQRVNTRTQQKQKQKQKQAPPHSTNTPTRKRHKPGIKALRMPPSPPLRRSPKRAVNNKFQRPQTLLARLLCEADYLVLRVLGYLTGEELVTVSQVNKQLRQLILMDKTLNARRTASMMRKKSHRDQVGKENYKHKILATERRTVSDETTATHPTLSPRKQLSNIQNLCGPRSPEKEPAPPRPLAQRFMEEARKLSKDEELQKCVKCKSPALVRRAQLRATCRLSTCGYDYCISCHLPTHRLPQDCPNQRPRTRQATAGIFSNRCKKNLRRL